MRTKKEVILVALFAVFFLSSIAFAVDCPLPDTGQNKCYDNSVEMIPCPSPGEDFYGQDAQYGPNLQSYTKLDENGNDLPFSATEWVMVRDNVAGLTWEVKQDKDDIQNYANPHDADNEYTWYDSNPETNGGNPGTPGDGTDTEDFINALNTAQFGGYNDWRMPTIKELPFIVHSDTYFPSIDPSYFPDTVSSIYWLSTTGAFDPYVAWYVNFDNGFLGIYGKSLNYYVRAVRGGQCGSFGDFVDNGDSTVTDTSTGLMWEIKTDDGGPRDKDNYYTWQQALSYCESLTLAGYNDWRLPDHNQLQSIVDYSTYSPTIDPSYFPDTVSSSYWSSTTYAYSTGQAWIVGFSSGGVGNIPKTGDGYVRAVRGGHWDLDSDGILDDGDNSGLPGDNPCIGGAVKNCDDNCLAVYNPDQADIDNDGMGDICDNCPNDYNPNQEDADSDEIGNECDSCPNDPDNDIDGDTVCGDVDNCPGDYNINQFDADADDIGDVCDNCPNDSNPDQQDTDSDDAGDVCDNCPVDFNPNQEDADGDDIGDVCDSTPTSSSTTSSSPPQPPPSSTTSTSTETTSSSTSTSPATTTEPTTTTSTEECSISIVPETEEVVSKQSLTFIVNAIGDCDDSDYEWSVNSEIRSSCDQSGEYTAGINFRMLKPATDVVSVVDHGNGDITAEANVTVSFGCPLMQIYGENSEEIDVLRQFRDDVLSQTPEGREIIKLYYQWSPVIVKAIEEDEELKEEVKEMIDKILPLIRGETE